jgi:hypothetical protein
MAGSMTIPPTAFSTARANPLPKITAFAARYRVGAVQRDQQIKVQAVGETGDRVW